MTFKSLLPLLFVTLCSNLIAKTITVSNNPSSPGQFTNVQTAINDAGTVNGDIILIQGSATNYPDITITKSLKIYGAGAYRSTPSNIASTIVTINVSANNVSISGMFFGVMNINAGVTGTKLEYSVCNNVLHINSSNNIIVNNRLPYIRLTNLCSNTLILNNVLGYISDYTGSTIFSNIIIKNNIFRGGNDVTTGTNYGSATAFEGFGTMAALQIYDNIFYKTGLGTIGNSSFSNNIFTTITTATVSANNNTNINNVFGMTQPNGNTFDGTQSNPTTYNLGATTGATVTASDGTQVGVNGGGITFAMRSESPIPYIRPGFNITPLIVGSGGTLNISVTATNGNQ
jgi:hypothetical protein